MPRRKDESQELYYFANALRNFLDLEPMYQDGRSLDNPMYRSNELIHQFYRCEYSILNSSISKSYQAT